MPSRSALVALAASTAALAVVLGGCTGDTGSSAEPSATPDAVPYVVLLGDSYISGEGARWAANTSGRPGPVDALGPRAYDDASNGEAVPGCHRAVTMDVPSDGYRTMNLACSGAQTRSRSSGGVFKPGLDFLNDGQGHRGQAWELRSFAREEPVAAVVVSIGGNDFGFGSLVGSCAGAFASSSAPCRTDADVRSDVSAERAAQVRTSIEAALRNVGRAMADAGYATDEWRLLVQTYPSPLPPAQRIRYGENLVERGLVGGCPFYDTDASWAERVVVPTINGTVEDAALGSGLDNVAVLDVDATLDGHRLCERGTRSFDEADVASWDDAGVADAVAWVNRVYTGDPPWQLQESLHPNYWGVLAGRACIATVLDGAEVC